MLSYRIGCLKLHLQTRYRKAGFCVHFLVRALACFKLSILVSLLAFSLIGCGARETLHFEDCQLSSQSCEIDSDIAKGLSIQLGVGNISPLVPFDIILKDAHSQLRSVTAALVGVDMNMGAVPIKFEQSTEKSSWHGKAATTVCSVNADMKWAISLELALDGNVHIRKMFILAANTRAE